MVLVCGFQELDEKLGAMGSVWYCLWQFWGPELLEEAPATEGQDCVDVPFAYIDSWVKFGHDRDGGLVIPEESVRQGVGLKQCRQWQ